MAAYPAIVYSQELCSLQITMPLVPVASSLITDITGFSFCPVNGVSGL